ncbi:hypothetical protein LTR08_002684 [Meristemomyces frigidus]|nr:hypothetical protein LTR08_002684 [Meristemomyces frigidus]
MSKLDASTSGIPATASSNSRLHARQLSPSPRPRGAQARLAAMLEPLKSLQPAAAPSLRAFQVPAGPMQRPDRAASPPHTASNRGTPSSTTPPSTKPKEHDRDNATTSPAPATPPHSTSPYYPIHLADPCTPGDLLHALTCGHRILTPTAPEPCASNCQGSKTAWANARGSGRPFCCALCVHDERGGRACRPI